MTELDRDTVIALLDRLGAEDDAAVLEAARTLHRSVSDAGVTWDDLLRPDQAAEPFEEEEDDFEEEDDDFEDGPEEEGDDLEDAPEEEGDDLEDEPEEEPARPARAVKPAPADLAGDAELIERLLAHKTLSHTAREELEELKRDMEEGRFEEMDSRYVRALAKRLGV